MSERKQRLALRILEIEPTITSTPNHVVRALLASTTALCEELDAIEQRNNERLDALKQRLGELEQVAKATIQAQPAVLATLQGMMPSPYAQGRVSCIAAGVDPDSGDPS